MFPRLLTNIQHLNRSHLFQQAQTSILTRSKVGSYGLPHASRPNFSTSNPSPNAAGAGGATAGAGPKELGSYSRGLSFFHWFGAAGIIFLMGSATVAGSIKRDDPATTPEKLKFRSELMHLHESVGLLMFAMIIPRVGIRLFGPPLPPPLPVPAWQQMASKATHGLLYGAMLFMPISGLAFGYFSCWGVPFFKWNVPGAPKEKYSDNYKALEKFFYENHHNVGHYLTYYIFPLHIAAVLFQTFVRKNNVLGRMNPFAKK